MAKAKKTVNKTKKNLNKTLYCYVEGTNLKYADDYGKSLFGSRSAYINALIAKDRGVKPKLGIKQPKI
jgi:hypothetical protein